MKIKSKILDILQKHHEEGVTREQLVDIIGISKRELRIFYDTLKQMQNEHLIYQKKNGSYAKVIMEQTDVGSLRTHKKGFGFIAVEGEEEDLFVRSQDMNGALDGDIVLFEKITDQLYPEKVAAKIVAVKERANLRRVGTVVPYNETYFSVHLDEANFKGEVLVEKKANTQLVLGHKVVVVPEEYPDDAHIVVRVVEIIGHEHTPGIDVLSIVKQYDIPITFPTEVEEQIARIPHEVLIDELSGRADFRQRQTITIDGADAKDLDDAVSVEKLPNGNYYLAVHIADVSHYVQRGAGIDIEALKRGTSVYLVDRVIPMLPVQLSNGICSLHPHVERLTMTAEMEIDRHGRIVAEKLMPSVIVSDERMTYEDVNKMLKQQDPQLIKRYRAIYPMLKQLQKLAKILERRRQEQGALDFAINEAKIVVDKHGKPIDIQVRKQDIAEKIIEQCMIAANEAVANYFSSAKLPSIYRVHGNPADTKLDAFRQVAANMGINVSKIKHTTDLKPKALQKLLTTIQTKSDYDLLATLLLRAMQKAEYATTNIGHFGLAMANYTHFTSPIRRYPDLVVHRLLRHFLFTGHAAELENEKILTELKVIAHETSIAERRAIECERAVTSMKMAEYMEDHIGETYNGVINGVMSSGFFVELENLVEGKVTMEALKDDYYIFLPEQLMLIGRRTKKVYRMGDTVKVKVESANKQLSEIRFTVVGDQKPKWRKERGTEHDKTNGHQKNKKRPRTKERNEYKGKDKSKRSRRK